MLGRRLDELLTVQADHELLDVFMGAQRHMRHLMEENRALQEETVRLVRRTEVRCMRTTESLIADALAARPACPCREARTILTCCRCSRVNATPSAAIVANL